MDWLANPKRPIELLKKYKYPIVIVILGLFLMVLPESAGKQKTEAIPPEAEVETLQDSLEAILSKISGAGKVSVLLSEYSGEEILYQTDETLSQSTETRNQKTETVLYTDGGRAETGLVRTVIAPVYKGAIVVCQGGDRPAVRLAVVEAVSKVTGLSTNQISVLKMK